MDNIKDKSKCESKQYNFEKTIKEYIRHGKFKLEKDLAGTREAIRLISNEKVKEFIELTDRGLSKPERELLECTIISGMFQAFCYGYGIGKIEGSTDNRIFL